MKRTALCLVNGRITALPDGDSLQDAGGNEVANIDLMSLRGTIDASGNPNYPAGENGDMYYIELAGKVGGVAGKAVEIGDAIVCTLDGTAAGDEATVGEYWIILNKDVVDTSAALRDIYTFNTDVIFDGVNQLSTATIFEITCPVSGFLVGTTLKMRSARSAGTLELVPHINGVAPAETGLNLQVDETTTTKDYATVTYDTDTLAVSAGDVIGFICTTTTFAPLNNAMQLSIVVEG